MGMLTVKLPLLLLFLLLADWLAGWPMMMMMPDGDEDNSSSSIQPESHSSLLYYYEYMYTETRTAKYAHLYGANINDGHFK